jgi:hypothetical protein
MFNSVVTWLMRKRKHQRDLFLQFPFDVQADVLRHLLEKASSTEFGRQHGFTSVHSKDDFRKRVPLQDYDSLKPYIERQRKGEQHLLWPTTVRWFAKSSGTTSDRSKFIPVSQEALEDCHFKGGKDMLGIYCHNFPDTRMFSGKGLSIGGSHRVDEANAEVFYGDLSAVLLQNLPLWTELYRTPKLEVALMDEWESKLDEMVRITLQQDITNIQGVPSWTLVLLNKVLEASGKRTIREVWPNLEVFFHGAVSFLPYRKQFEAIIGNPGIHYMETYNASEGFFAMQDRPESDELLLMLDYGIYYEFIPMEEWESPAPRTLLLEEVETGRNYAVVISTNAGLWRYRIGDTVTFTSLRPHRIRITGRTRHFINAFGEEVIIENAEQALQMACERTGALIREYTAGPLYLEGKSKGRHEWLIEFAHVPVDMDYFIETLDTGLKSINSDYDAKRYKDMVLQPPLVRSLPAESFYAWLRSKGKLGGQHKVPRLSNDRTYLDDILRSLGQ